MVIPNTWTWTWTRMLFPINLVFQMSDFDTKLKETSLPCIWLEILTENPGQFVLTNTNNWSWFQVGWSGRWWRCWRDRPTNWSSKRLTMCDLKKGRILALIRSIDHHFTYSTLHWLGNRINYQWSQITFLLSIRRTGSQQIDF